MYQLTQSTRISSTSALPFSKPARTSATVPLRNSAGEGPGMGGVSQEESETQTITGNQTVGHVNVRHANSPRIFGWSIPE